MIHQRKNSLLSQNISETEENKFITEALTTPYEKVIKVLMSLKTHLEDTKADQIMIKDLDWVVHKIQSHKLYIFEHSENTEEFEKMYKNSSEVKSFFDYLNNYSENKENKEFKGRINKKISRTTKVVPANKEPFTGHRRRFSIIKEEIKTDGEGEKKEEIIKFSNRKSFVKLSKYNSINNNNEEISSASNNNGLNSGSKFEENWDDDVTERNNLTSIPILNKGNIKLFNNYYEEDQSSIQQEEDNIQCDLIFQDEIQEVEKFKIKEIFYDFDKIMEFDFNIFEYAEVIGKPYVLIEGTKIIFEYMDLNKLINIKNFDNFLRKVRDGYKNDVSYHNNIHGFDVCQTVGVFLTQANIIDLIAFTEYDTLSLIMSALVHDIGHPGLTNVFQINTFSDIALTYNDRSVLENYHISEAFKIILNPESNILGELENSDFKNVRKRMIDTILATDMIYHARIQSYMKNRISINNIKNGLNQDKIINKDSVTFIDDQQEVMNFLIHTADISHNAKDFNISHKWTYLLMEEFWKQGDTEKSLNLPISFLCDRNTAEVPKSQIGFITGIIIPTFDVLCDMFPALSYFKNKVYNNIEEWRKIVEENKMEKETEQTELK